MKKILFFLLLSSYIVKAQELQSFLSFASFNSEDGSFLETYLAFNSNTLSLKEDEGQYQGFVDVFIKIYNNNNIIFQDNYLLQSPKFNNKTNNLFFIDQQRIPLEDGDYLLEVSVSDHNQDFIKTHLENIQINYENISISDIQLVDTYTLSEDQDILSKSGYRLSPYVSNFFPQSTNELIYYFEIYNTSLLSDSRYIINTYIESFETNISLFDYNKTLRKTSSLIESNLLKFNISHLPTGNYNLVCEIRSAENERLFIKKLFFQRSNHFTAIKNHEDLNTIDLKGTFVTDMTNKDSLRQFIDYLYPICTSQENVFAQNQLMYDDLELMKKFFFNFWQDRNALEPGLEWKNYLRRVKEVNKEFKYFKIQGYLSDRGRVYLQYGSPNTRQVEIDTKGNKPYEIWHYYKLGNRSNQKFVFIDNNRTGEYKLEFSNVDGEESNLEWIEKVEQDEYNNSDFRNNYINPR